MNYYDTIAPSYNELYTEEQIRKWNAAKRLIVFQQTDHVLDLGCGTGIISYIIAKKVAKVTAIDSSKRMINHAQQAKNITYYIADAASIPFPDKSFDKTVLFTVLQDIKDQDAALKEIKRVTKGEVLLTILKRNKNLEKVKEKLSKYFVIKKTIEEEKDFIFLLS